MRSPTRPVVPTWPIWIQASGPGAPTGGLLEGGVVAEGGEIADGDVGGVDGPNVVGEGVGATEQAATRSPTTNVDATPRREERMPSPVTERSG
jgi:hypothetical protein